VTIDRIQGAFVICSFWAAEHLARGGGTLAEGWAAPRSRSAVLRVAGLFTWWFGAAAHVIFGALYAPSW